MIDWVSIMRHSRRRISTFGARSPAGRFRSRPPKNHHHTSSESHSGSTNQLHAIGIPHTSSTSSFQPSNGEDVCHNQHHQHHHLHHQQHPHHHQDDQTQKVCKKKAKQKNKNSADLNYACCSSPHCPNVSCN